MKIVATIEARMNSIRLPGKVLKDIGGIRSLQCQIERLSSSQLVDEIVIATTVNKCDDQLEDFANENGINIFRGSENDILARILGAAKSVQGELLVQTTGDCPLIDPTIVDEAIRFFLDAKGKVDFVSNEIERSYPIGLDCRVFPVSILEEVDKICDDPIHRIHGSTYIYIGLGKDRYKSHNLMAPKHLNFPEWRWTLDTYEDLTFLKQVGKHFGRKLTELSAIDLAEWLIEHPEVTEINSDVRQKSIDEG